MRRAAGRSDSARQHLPLALLAAADLTIGHLVVDPAPNSVVAHGDPTPPHRLKFQDELLIGMLFEHLDFRVSLSPTPHLAVEIIGPPL